MSDGAFRVVSLYVQGINIDALSLVDVGEYLADLAKLLGGDASPRFHGIKRSGSMTLSARIAAEHEIDVKTRGFLLRTGGAPEDAVQAEDRISKRLGIHRARRATLLDSRGAKIIEIPIEKPAPVTPSIPNLNRAGSLQGKIMRIGGKQDIVSVEIQDVDGHVYLCKATRELAKKLACQMFDPTIRVSGHGRWMRAEDSIWRVDEFQISDFEVLEDDALVDVINELRAIPSAWKALEDPDSEMTKIRSGGPRNQ
jgi:hypothetical protein